MSTPVKINDTRLADMTDPAADQTYERLAPLFSAIAITTIQPPMQAFAAAAATYSAALKQQRISVVTEDIQNLDHNRDRGEPEIIPETPPCAP